VQRIAAPGAASAGAAPLPPRWRFGELHLKLFALAVACVATGALLAGCSSTNKQPTPQKDADFHYLLDMPTNWTENKVDALPPLPNQADLLPFEVSQNTPLSFFIDAKSLTVGSDGVVRYTVVVTSPSGARNVNYEGIHCDNYTWRLYAGLNEDHDGWDRTVENDWTRIEDGNLNAYRASLYQDFFCANRIPVGSAKTIVNNIRYNRTQGELMTR
jgi:CNP1-like family